VTDANSGRPPGGSPGLLRAVALLAAAVGAVGSLALMFRAIQHPPLFLLVLFIGWVISPFMGLAVAGIASKRFSVLSGATLACVTLFIALGSLASYGGVVPMPPGSRPAFVFLVVPLASWLLMIIVALVAVRRSR
jgi:hypothetical protein